MPVHQEQPDMRAILQKYSKLKPDFEKWLRKVMDSLEATPEIKKLKPLFKSRIKSPKSLAKKVKINYDPITQPISSDNLTFEIEDLCGLRMIVPHKGCLAGVDQCIRSREGEDWRVTATKYYAWHEKEVKELIDLGQEPMSKESIYCSRHYILTPPTAETYREAIKCELQVRTILEEALFENEHEIRYKNCHHQVITELFQYMAQIFEVHDQVIKSAYDWADILE